MPSQRTTVMAEEKLRKTDQSEIKNEVEKDDHQPASIARRSFIKGVALTGGALAVGGAASFNSRALAGQFAPLPNPSASGIEHIVVVMMENRSFDHFLGWLPHADGKQAGLQFVDRQGVSHPTHALAPDFQGCGFADPDHSFAGGRTEFDNGRC